MGEEGRGREGEGRRKGEGGDDRREWGKREEEGRGREEGREREYVSRECRKVKGCREREREAHP